MGQRLLARIHAFNAAHPWSHNEHYHRWVLNQLPPTVSRVLDVGCGSGDLVRAVAHRFPRADVEGVDIDPAFVEHARRLSEGSSRTSFTVGSLLDVPADRRYDAISALAVLHHVPFGDALRRLSAALAPGGTLLVVGCYREETLVDRALSMAAIPANMAAGLYRNPAGRAAPLSMSAPTAAATMTLREIRDLTAAILPGARIRRGLLWRYLLRYPG